MSFAMSKEPARSEEQIPLAIDKCIADGIIKTGSGLALGAALSLILFRRRVWPVYLGIGLGAGMALTNCQANLNSTDVVKVSWGLCLLEKKATRNQNRKGPGIIKET